MKEIKELEGLEILENMTTLQKEIVAKAMFDELVDTCECCEEKLGVWTENPFDVEIHEEHNMQYLCKECHYELMMDV